jgi:hypothetical protein
MKNIFSDKFLLAAGVILVAFNLFFICYKTNTPEDAAQAISTESNTKILTPTASLHQVFQAGLIIPLLRWSNDQKVTDELGNNHDLNKVFGTTSKLVFRFSEFSCNTCIDREIANLKQLASSIGKENIVLLATYSSIRDLAVFKRINHLDLPIYNIPQNVFSTDQVGGTFLFIANTQQKAFMPFIPDKEDGNLSLEYYKFIAPLFAPPQ